MRAALHVRDLSVGYPGRRVVERISPAPFEAGTLCALIGSNGAGKSTLLRGLAGLVGATGSVRLGGRELVGLPLAQFSGTVGYMPQSMPQRVTLTVYEAMLAALRSAAVPGLETSQTGHAAFAALERLGIADIAMRGLDELSGGQRQLASLAQAIARQPQVLLLDEPTSALDLAHQYRVMSVVDELTRERGIVTIVVLHDIALACRWCSRLLVLSGGTLAADGPPGEAVTPELLHHVYGVSARVERCSRGYVQVMVDGCGPAPDGGRGPATGQPFSGRAEIDIAPKSP